MHCTPAWASLDIEYPLPSLLPTQHLLVIQLYCLSHFQKKTLVQSSAPHLPLSSQYVHLQKDAHFCQHVG